MLEVSTPVESQPAENAPRNAEPKPRSPQPTVGTESRLRTRRVFSRADCHPFDEIEWDRRKASITDEKGGILFEQDQVEVPASWSMLATNVVASKYFYGEPGTAERETSVRQLIHRVARTIADWGLADGYFETPEDAEIYYDELVWLCLNQYGAFNSPVWFNCGLHHEYGIGKGSNAGNYHVDPKTGMVDRAPTPYEYPQCSACFIQSVDDSMEAIMELARSEAMLFKFGSGTGTDLSTIRSSREKLSGGGAPSGPLSFLKVYDAIASVVKSGGKTRRAAKMNTLKDRHPDIKEFIEAKSTEERKAWALIDAGYSGDFNGEAYGSIAFQNENLSVRLSDAFMEAALNDEPWQTHWVTDPKKPGPVYPARELLRGIADGTWTCGDPGVQFEDTIQRWHTCKTTGPINASNPCSEYMFLDDSACNLASLNLMKFVDEKGVFDTHRFQRAVEIFITAQDILVDRASYPTAQIALNSHRYRPLGLGYANLGALLMSMGLPYDSEEARGMAGALTAIMHGRAYAHSARLARILGPFAAFDRNRDPMLDVVEQHLQAVKAIGPGAPAALLHDAKRCLTDALEAGRLHGFRNAQVTVLAPTGTIGFLMDCDTTGVEPDIALVKYKLLAGGGMLKIVNRTVPGALARLGYSREQIDDIVGHIEENDTIEGAPHIEEPHLPVFDCAFKPLNGSRHIHYLAHIRMMAAVQPFLSGAISKTVNMPTQATVEEIMETYVEGWRLGLKAIAIYRDGCKRSQPVTTGKEEPAPTGAGEEPRRRRMPATRHSLTHRFEIAGHEGYLTVGLYENGDPGELFITMAKEGSTIGGIMDCFGTAISLCLQYGVPLQALVEKFAHTRFEPSGFTKNPAVPIAKSMTDYIFRWLEHEFIQGRDREPTEPAPHREAPVEPAAARRAHTITIQELAHIPRHVDDQFKHFMQDAPVCDHCGSITVRNGACYRCHNCGNSMGCS